ncbi:hypothetical protein [Microbacterium algeriense]|uniref:hypothetical protein n=1 Tax=Microbacterium algeriense TaxID=2615184 RepID=UPI003D739B82
MVFDVFELDAVESVGDLVGDALRSCAGAVGAGAGLVECDAVAGAQIDPGFAVEISGFAL